MEGRREGEQVRAQRSRLRILEAALALLAERGFEAMALAEVARVAGVSVGLVCRYFPSKDHFALALYNRLADDFVERAAELPAEGVAARFEAAMRLKLGLLEPYRGPLTVLVSRALDPSARAAALGPATEVVRAKVASVFQLVVLGASDAPPAEAARRMARSLYLLHLGLVLLWTQLTPPSGGLHEVLRLVGAALGWPGLLPAIGALGPLGERIDTLLGELLGSATLAAPDETAEVVLERLFRRRRLLQGTVAADGAAARALHLPRVQAFIDAGEPVQLVLPAFPAKAPNPRKVLGRLPDTAETVALESLASLLEEIGEAYRGGAELILCSDGLVFADVVGVSDAVVGQYRRELAGMVAEIGAGRMRLFGLEEAFATRTAGQARDKLLQSYAPTLAELKARAEESPAQRALIDGIHRFLFEDELVRRPELSRNQARQATRAPAYEVVRRSEAWGRLVAAAFPRAVRLSIHPQPEVSPKIGINLMPTEDAWLTPWHGVAVLQDDRFRLMRRHEAEALGAELVLEDGQPSYMALPGKV